MRLQPDARRDAREHIDQRYRLLADKALGHLGPGEDHRHAGRLLVHVRFAPQPAGAEIVAVVARIEHPGLRIEAGRGERVDQLSDIAIDKADEPEIGGDRAPQCHRVEPLVVDLAFAIGRDIGVVRLPLFRVVLRRQRHLVLGI